MRFFTSLAYLMSNRVSSLIVKEMCKMGRKNGGGRREKR
jgi:hypothetical protein